MNKPRPPRHSKLSRRIIAGVQGKLDFDFACQKGHGFTEKYLHSIVHEIAVANSDHHREVVKNDVALDVIQTVKPGPRRGAPRTVDVAIVPRDEQTEALENAKRPEVSVAIEVKWAKSSHCRPETIFEDLYRLQLVKQAHPEANCIFVLAGPVRDIEKLGITANTSILNEDPGRSFGSIVYEDQTILCTEPRPYSFSLANDADKESCLEYAPLSDISTRYLTQSLHRAADWTVMAWEVFDRRYPSYVRGSYETEETVVEESLMAESFAPDDDYEIDQFQEEFEAAARAHIVYNCHDLPSPWPSILENHEDKVHFDFGTAVEDVDNGSEENHWSQVYGTVELNYSELGESIRLGLSGNANTGTPERNINIDTMEEIRPQDPH